jgi:biotin carboxyl carrier protein
VPVPGLSVRQDQQLFVLEPVLSPAEQVQLDTLRRGIEADLTKASDTLALARIELKRMEELRDQKIKQQQEVDQAELRVKHALADEAAAKAKLKLLTLTPIPVSAPRAGTVLSVHVSPGQYVPASAPLVTVADLGTVWVRVPVPADDLPSVDATRPTSAVLRSGNGGPARVGSHLGEGWDHVFPALPVASVPVVDPTRHTADLLYHLVPYSWQVLGREATAASTGWADPLGAGPAPLQRLLAPPPMRTPFAKDQLLTVFVPLGKLRTESVVPYSAVIFDSHGGAWIYLDRTPKQAAQHLYERRRVDLGPMVAGGVVIRPAARRDDRVVVSGAGLLFSREFHQTPAKSAPVDDDD